MKNFKVKVENLKTKKLKIFLFILLIILFLLTLFNGLRVWGNRLFSQGHVIEALVVEPYNYLYHFVAGTTLLQDKHSFRAVQHLQRAIKLNPSYTDTLNNLAVALIMEKRYDEAHKVLVDLNQLDSKDGYGKENLEILEKMVKKEP